MNGSTKPSGHEPQWQLASPRFTSKAQSFDESPSMYGFVLTNSNRTPACILKDSQEGSFDNHIDLLQSMPSHKTPPQRRQRGGRHDDLNAGRMLGTISVVAITFFFGCGGPLGSEELISLGGPLIAFLSIIIYPIVFTFPYGAVVAELCTAFPEDGGFPLAVRNAFGQFWGLQVGYWSWIGTITTGAIYPSILVELLGTHANLVLSSPVTKYFLKMAIALVLSAPSFLGTDIVSHTMILFLAIVMTCTGIYVLWAYAASDAYDALGQVKTTKESYNAAEGVVESSGDMNIDWFALLNNLFWNFDGIQMASVFGGQVLIPARVYPRAISITIVLTVLVYLLPLPATVANQFINWTTFQDGSYGKAAIIIGGQFLYFIMVMVNFATTIGMSVSSTFCGSTEIAGMAQSGMLHMFLSHRNQRFSSPHNAIGLTVGLTLVLLAFNTDTLLSITNTFACFVAIIIFATGVQLRHKFPHFPRPATVPGGPCVMLLLATIPVTICIIIVLRTITASVTQLLTILLFVSIGLLYSAMERWRGGAEVQVVRF